MGDQCVAVRQPSIRKAVDMSSSILLNADARQTGSDTGERLLDHGGLGDKRVRAHRWQMTDLPWLSSVKLPWGLEVRLLNISKSGLLIESGSKLDAGSTIAFHLSGPTKSFTVSARIVRSHVGGVNGRGVRYLAAAFFDKTVDLVEPRPVGQERSIAGPKSLAHLLVRVMEDREKGLDTDWLRASFEEGIKQLVRARGVEIREEMKQATDGTELVCFPVPAGRGFSITLQATFDANDTPQEEEIRILKAAATLAAFILQFENIAPHGAMKEGEAVRPSSAW